MPEGTIHCSRTIRHFRERLRPAGFREDDPVPRQPAGRRRYMDKKEINSPKLTANFLIWICGVGTLLLVAFLAHFVWRIL